MKLRAGLRVAWLLGLLAATVTPSRAQEAKIGKLDWTRLMQEFQEYQKLNEEYRAEAQRMLQQVEDRSHKFPLLLDEEWNQLVELSGRQTELSAAERATVDRLRALSEERDRELAQLEMLAEPTEEQRNRRKDLTRIRTQCRQGIDDMRKRYQQQLADKDAELTGQLKAKIDQAVEQVAKAQGLSIVLSSEVVFYGGIDITDEVIKVLNTPPAAGNG